MAKRRSYSFAGPGAMITAAFIGPGTVTVCMLAGTTYGFTLLWTVLLSIFITMLFQEMASRLGIISRLDLTSLIKREIKAPFLKIAVLILVVASIVIGNGAYEAGNISGGALGLDTFFSEATGSFRLTPIAIGIAAFVILWMGKPKVLERSLATLVGLMSISFLATALLTQPDLGELLKGLALPQIPENSLMIVLGVVGTTIVPYNLFLHTSLAKDKWNQPEDINSARKDTIFSILVGGLISLAIVITAASLQGMQISDAEDLGKGLEPVFGSLATYLVSLGLMAAGLTSAITAPLAASYVMAGGFGWDQKSNPWKFRATWMTILGIGVIFSSIGFKPIDVIRFAQVANGLLLPAIGIILVWLCSRSAVLGKYKNKSTVTFISSVLILIIAALGIRGIWIVFS